MENFSDSRSHRSQASDGLVNNLIEPTGSNSRFNAELTPVRNMTNYENPRFNEDFNII